MPLPVIAIVGRPNVGKSSLANMLAGRKMSIVDPTPGTTRDRVSSIVTLPPPDNRGDPIQLELTDTGGFGIYTEPGKHIDDAGKDLRTLAGDIEHQIAQAVGSADLILFVIDAQAGVTAQDEIVAKLLREGGLGHTVGGSENVIMVANKCDGPKWEAHAMEAAGLGFGEPLLVSAGNNYMRREFSDALYERVRELKRARRKQEQARRDAGEQIAPPEQIRPAEMQLAIVGKRNAGKSTLVNTLAGEKRVIVSEIAGTTRDAVDVRFELEGKSFVAIDTAGLRKKKSFADRIEWYALDRLQLAVRRCDVALLMIDATVAISQVDQQIAHMLVASFKPVVIVVNKWDLAKGKPIVRGSGAPDSRGRNVTPEDYETYLRGELKGLDFAPIAFISGQNGENVRETIDLAFDLFQQAQERATTGKLNRLIRDIIEHQGPSSKIGSFAKVLYVAQIRTCPPTIVLVVNKPELFTVGYERFLMNRLREHVPFPEVPIRLIIRARKAQETPEATAEAAAQAAEAELMPDAMSYFDDDAPAPRKAVDAGHEPGDMEELAVFDPRDSKPSRPEPKPRGVPQRRSIPADRAPRADKPVRGGKGITKAMRPSKPARTASKSAGPSRPSRGAPGTRGSGGAARSKMGGAKRSGRSGGKTTRGKR